MRAAPCWHGSISHSGGQGESKGAKGRGKPKLAYAGKRVVLKCQFSSHVEILLAVYCALDQDIPVNRDKVAKTNLLGESRVINYPYQHLEDTINKQRD